MSLIVEHSVWWLVIAPVVGFVYAWILYRNTRDIFSPRIQILLGIFRFAVVTLLVILLSGVLVKHVKNRYEKPLVVLAFDNSQSMVQLPDSLEVRRQWQVLSKDLETKLTRDFEVIKLRFGSSVSDSLSFEFNEPETNISEVFTYIQERFPQRVISGLVLASDGIINRGRDPSNMPETRMFPVFPIAYGDTSTRKDLSFHEVRFNEITFSNSQFPIEIYIRAESCKNQRSSVSIYSNHKKLWSSDFTIYSDNQVITFSPLLTAEKPGLIRYTLEINPVEGEINTQNNRMDIFVEVKDSRLKVLILADAPHPDIAAIKKVFAFRDIYQIEDDLISDFKKDILQYDLIIFHQLPSTRVSINDIYEQTRKAGKPVLFILGQSSDIELFNAMQIGLKINGQGESFVNAYPVLSSDFQLFKTDNRLLETLDKLPPLISPDGIYSIAPTAIPYFYQKVDNVLTSNPLIVFHRNQNQEIGIIAGEGLWWWRNILYQNYQNHEIFEEFFHTIVQYLISGESTGNFRVRVANRFQGNEHVKFSAELYDATFKLMNDPEVHLEIKDENGVTYPYIFNRVGSAYELDAGIFNSGVYYWTATTEFNKAELTAKGNFVVEQTLAEKNYLKANHALLFSLSQKSGGKLIYPSQVDSIPLLLKKTGNTATKVYSEESFFKLNDFWWLLALIVVLISAEWVIRKWSGIL